MKEKQQYNAFDTFCYRIPLFPFSFFRDLTRKSEITKDDFLELLNNPVLREAIYLASPELEAQLQKWEEGSITDPKKIERLQFSLLKYAFRISTRCTPFGLFASCAAGSFADVTKAQFDVKKPHLRQTRFDMSFLSQLQLELLKEEKIRKELLYYPNTSLYVVGDHFRYIEYAFKNKKRIYSLEGFSSSEYIEKIIKEAKNGKKIKELASVIVDEEITLDEAQDFIEELIQNQVLVSELELTVTGENYFQKLMKRIAEIPEIEDITQWLEQLNDQLIAIDSKIGNSIDNYKQLIETSSERVKDFDAKYLLQTDSFSNFKANTLNKEIASQLEELIPVFVKMGIPSSNPKLDQFKKDFRKRFDDAEVSLNVVLDSEIGIAYGDRKYDNSQFLDDVPVGGSGAWYQQFIWRSFDSVMQEKLFEAYQNQTQIITIEDKDIEKFPVEWKSPDTFSAMIEVIPDMEQEKIYVANFGGSSGANLLGRFTEGNKKLYKHVQEILDYEDQVNPNKLIAEIVHLPESRVGNILQRANNRKYEITYLGQSSLKTSKQISIDDLLVSVQQNQVILRSKRFQKQVIPKLTNAHNFKGNPLPIYEFLCDLQNEEKRSSVGFSWSPILEKNSFLPRVEYKNCIISKARWIVKVSDFEKLTKEEDILKAVDSWRHKLKLPELVDFSERDNKLLINLKNKNSILMLYNTVRKRGAFILEEFLFKDVETTLNDFYCNQYVVSFYNNSNAEEWKKK